MSESTQIKKEKRSISEPVKKDNQSKLYENYIGDEFAKQLETMKARYSINGVKIGFQHLQNLKVNLRNEFASSYQEMFKKRFKDVKALHKPDEVPDKLKKFSDDFIKDMKDLKDIEYDNLYLSIMIIFFQNIIWS